MPRPLVAVVAGLASVLMAVVMVVAVRTVVGSTTWQLERQRLVCEQDTTLSGYQGFCVERLSRTEAIVVPGRREIAVVARIGGADGRSLIFDDPFPEDADLVVRPRNSEIAVVDPADGTALVISRERIGTLAD